MDFKGKSQIKDKLQMELDHPALLGAIYTCSG